jgi:hypothetical protein
MLAIDATLPDLAEADRNCRGPGRGSEVYSMPTGVFRHELALVR